MPHLDGGMDISEDPRIALSVDGDVMTIEGCRCGSNKDMCSDSNSNTGYSL
jgi:hypothetical protein